MSNDRPIIAVRFHVPVSLGTWQPVEGWWKDKPATGQQADKVTPRMGDPDFGEQRTSIVFEVRLGNRGGAIGDVDVEVPASNLAEVQRLPPEPKVAPSPAGAKK